LGRIALAFIVALGFSGSAMASPPDTWLEKKIVENVKKTNECVRELHLYGKSKLVYGDAHESSNRSYKRWALNKWRLQRQFHCSRERKARKSAGMAIRVSFGTGPGDPNYRGNATQQAKPVAWCESRNTLFTGGLYRGLFQMGGPERRQYAYPWDDYNDFLEQAQAAARMFFDVGRSWARWSCKPTGHVG
jgi:hypothetical protein